MNASSLLSMAAVLVIGIAIGRGAQIFNGLSLLGLALVAASWVAFLIEERS
ncbi:hypothetical protein [Lysinibacter cavernae]|uniref:Uncharacterized protein n=1 Tax=Lysinibacter cavernae TaxID=1640652 RepID=A0A7X5QYW4_9MICO|nr:hypothetical protein [Lysinibacter cavernae]NIH52516.1 hypothetical protein [Lysinibacter cavernae]